MSKLYTYDAWVDTFKPVPNNISKYPEQMAFETYGEEYEFVKGTDNKLVWTEVDGDYGTYIVAGLHFVNRIQYYITEEAWDDEWTEVPSWVYRTCDCMEEETNGILSFEGDPNPECPECNGEGTVDIPCDTVLALKDIYGEEANIVG